MKSLLFRIAYVAILFSAPAFSYSQKMAKEGMVSQPLNYHSFTQNEAESNGLPYNAPCVDCKEDLSARNELTRKFYGTGADKNLVYSQSAYTALNIKNGSGNWVPVDARIKPMGNQYFAAKDQSAPVAIDINAGICTIKNIYGTIGFNNRPELLWKKSDGSIQSLGKANLSNYTAGNDGVYVVDAWPGIDMEMRVLLGAIKTNYVLKERPLHTQGEYLIRDEFQLPNGLSLKSEGEEITIETASGNEAYHISSCIGYDSQVQRNNASQNFNYQISGNVLDMVIPLSVIQSPQLVYPYIIDPLVNSSNTLPQASITGSSYNATCFTGYCAYNMTVPSPANAIIVDATWSFNYVAAGSCWRADGAVTFTSGACASPNQAGFYWFCNLNSAGTCTGTNISLFSDVSSCMPAPACTPQNVPFQMRFYRCYSSGAGCSNSCIGAASPWTITLIGQTVAVASASVNGSGSTTICQGASATLNAAGTYGVPAYTYTWEPGSLSGSSVTVSPSTTTTYTLTVTDACSQTSTANVTVNVTPQPAAPAITSNSPVCAGQTLTLGTTASGNYVWTGPNGFTSNIQNPSIPSASAANSGTYSLYTVSASCTSVTATQNVVVNPTPPTPTAGGNSPICQGSSLNLTSSGGSNYYWTGPNSFTSTSQNPVINPATTADAGTYSVVNIAGACTSAVANYNVVINPTPTTPVISSNSPVCANNPINLSSSTSSTGTYVWTGPNGFTSNLQNPTIASATTANSGTYSLYTVENGCTSATSTLTVNVVSPPAFAPAFTTNSPVCEGTTITLNASSYPFVNYIWSGPNGYSATGQNVSIPSATLANAGNYSLSVAASGCTSVATVHNVIVNPAPAAPTVGGNSPVCAGSSINLTATGSGPGTYYWTGPNSFTSTSQNPTISSANSTNAGTYSVVYIASGCSSAVANYNVIVNPVPTTPVASSNSPVCVGSAINLSTTSTTTGTYVWTGPNAFTSNTQNPTIASAASTNSGNYNLNIVENGCTSAVATIAVNVVNPPVVPSFTTNSPVCEGATITLNATFYPIVNYIWSGPNGYSASGQNVSIPSATSANAGTYSLYLAASGCTSTAATMNVVVNPAPAAPVLGGNSPVCAGSAINLTATGIGTGTYSWTGPNAFASTNQNPTISSSTTANAGTYTAVFIQNSCTSAVANYNVVVNPIPATPTVSSNSPVCIGDAINLTTPFVANATYAWSGPSFTSANQNPTIGSATVSMSGNYSVTVTSNGCTSLPGTTSVVVSPPPAAPTINSNTPVCEGSTLNLGTNVVAGNYFWNGPAGWSSNSQNNTIASFTAAQAGTYSLYVVNGTCTSATATLIVQIAPTPQVTYTGPTQICGSDAVLTASVNIAAPGTIATVTWNSAGQIGTGTSINYSFPQTAPSSANGNVVVVSGDNCITTVPFSLQILDVPVSAFTYESLCDGQSIQFHEQHTWEGNETTTPNYSWIYNGSSFSTAANPTYNFTAPGTYNVTLLTSNPSLPLCAGTVTIPVIVLASPTLDFTFKAECVKDVQFIGTVTPDSLVTSYAWNYDDGSNGSGASSSHAYLQTGLYNVAFTVITTDGCTTTVTKPVQIDKASTDLPEIPNIITPNGDNVNDFIDVTNLLGDCGDFEFVIFSRWGNVVYTQKTAGPAFIGKNNGGGWLTPGVYFYSLLYNDTKSTEPLQ